MKIDLSRFGAWTQTKFDRVRAKHLTVGGVFGTFFILICFFVVTLWPVIRSEKLDWTSWGGGWKRAISLSWIPLLAALYLKYSESFKRSRTWDRLTRRRRISRQVITGKAIKDLCVALNEGAKDFTGIRESLLQAAAIGVSEMIGMNDNCTVTATLLEFAGADLLKMRVVSRSTRERPCGTEYPRDHLVAWFAIRDGRIKFSDDIKTDARWENLDGKPYRTVAAVPIGYGGKAVAAISLDCDVPFAFYGRILDIAIQLEPYAASLALTYGKDALYHECHYDPHHPA